jgi:flagellar hook-length control protein FliK
VSSLSGSADVKVNDKQLDVSENAAGASPAADFDSTAPQTAVASLGNSDVVSNNSIPLSQAVTTKASEQINHTENGVESPFAISMATSPEVRQPLPAAPSLETEKVDSIENVSEKTDAGSRKAAADVSLFPAPRPALYVQRATLLGSLAPRVNSSQGQSPSETFAAQPNADASNARSGGSSKDSTLEQRSEGTPDSTVVAPSGTSKNSPGNFASALATTQQLAPSATPVSAVASLAPTVGGPVSPTASAVPPPTTHESPNPDPTPAALPAPQTDPTSPSHFVSDAQLSQTAGRSEMRIAMQSNDLGSIELHAKVSGDSLGANITVEKRDAHTALATELPALQQALSDKQLRVDQISLMHGPLHATAGDSPAQHFAGQGQGGRRHAQNFSQGARTSETSSFLPSTVFSMEPANIFDAQGRLSVLA